MQFLRSEVSKLFAIGFVAGALMVGAASASDWGEEFTTKAYAQEQEASATAAE